MLELFRAVFAPPRDLILLVAAGWLGLALAEKRAKNSPIGEKSMDALVGALALGFLLGGRLLYAAAHLSAFISSPASLISLNPGLFDTWAGIAAAALITATVIQRGQMPFRQALDVLTPFLAALGIGLALSHLASGAAFGKETSLPWAINLWGALRHPTQIYELLAASGILVAVWVGGSRHSAPGQTFLIWVALAAGSRLIIEGFRGDSTLVLGGLRLAQIIAWIVLTAALIGLELLNRQAAEQPEAPREGSLAVEADAAPLHAGKRKRAAPGKDSAQ